MGNELVIIKPEDYADVPLEELAKLINGAHSEVGNSMRYSAIQVVQNGARLIAAKAKCTHGTWLPWLGKNCPEISQRTAKRYMTTYRNQSNRPLLADLDSMSPTEAYRALKVIPEKSDVHVSNNSGENEWYTPEYIIDAARNAMGSIDLDPASCEAANLTVNAEEYYTKEDDGLNRKWHGNIWLNPPYAQPLITNFCERVSSERDNYNQAIVLVNNATETVWFRYLVSVADAICFTNGRVKFIDKAGDPSGAPLQGQAVVYVGDNFAAFYENFKEIGWIAKIEE